MIDPEQGYLRRALKRPLDEIWLMSIDTPNVVAIRNKVAKRFGFWTGNYAVTVLRSMFKWGILYGHLKDNPAKGVPELERPADMAVQHPSWSDPEFEIMFAEAKRRGWNGVALGLAFGRFASWPIGDVISQPRTAWQDPRLVYIRHKDRQRRLNSVAAPDRLREIILELLPPAGVKHLVVNQAGQPYSESGMRTMVYRLCSELAKEKKVRHGLNIHGLRHSLGKELYDLGLERGARKAMMAHVTDQASMVYERDGDRAAMADRAVVALNRKHKRAK
jgi:integrase